MTVLIYMVVLSLPFLMPFVARYLEEAVEQKAKAKYSVQYQAAKPESVSSVSGEVSEALQILELRYKPSEYEIRLAHRNMIRKNHPDNGGSIYFASKINYARDVLLKTL